MPLNSKVYPARGRAGWRLRSSGARRSVKTRRVSNIQHAGLTKILTLLLVSLSLQLLVALDAVKELIAALRGLDMLDSDVDALLQLLVADDFVDLNTDGTAGDVEHNTSAAVVVLVGHTLVDSTISLDVYVVTDLHVTQVSGQGRKTALAEVLGEHVAGASTVTVGVRHF